MMITGRFDERVQDSSESLKATARTERLLISEAV